MSREVEWAVAEKFMREALRYPTQTLSARETWGPKGTLGSDDHWRYPFIQAVKTLILRPMYLLITIRRIEVKSRKKKHDRIKYQPEYVIEIRDELAVTDYINLVKLTITKEDEQYPLVAELFSQAWSRARIQPTYQARAKTKIQVLKGLAKS